MIKGKYQVNVFGKILYVVLFYCSAVSAHAISEDEAKKGIYDFFNAYLNDPTGIEQLVGDDVVIGNKLHFKGAVRPLLIRSLLKNDEDGLVKVKVTKIKHYFDGGFDAYVADLQAVDSSKPGKIDKYGDMVFWFKKDKGIVKLYNMSYKSSLLNKAANLKAKGFLHSIRKGDVGEVNSYFGFNGSVLHESIAWLSPVFKSDDVSIKHTGGRYRDGMYETIFRVKLDAQNNSEDFVVKTNCEIKSDKLIFVCEYRM